SQPSRGERLMHPEIQAIVQFTLGWLFIWSATAKVRDVQSFVDGLSRYYKLSGHGAWLAAVFICAAELLVGVCHLVGFWLVGASMLALTMLCAFGVSAGWVLHNKSAVPCMCLGSNSEDLVSGETLARLFIMATAEFYVMVKSYRGHPVMH